MIKKKRKETSIIITTNKRTFIRPCSIHQQIHPSIIHYRKKRNRKTTITKLTCEEKTTGSYTYNLLLAKKTIWNTMIEVSISCFASPACAWNTPLLADFWNAFEF
jgi:hypothetical protein